MAYLPLIRNEARTLLLKYNEIKELRILLGQKLKELSDTEFVEVIKKEPLAKPEQTRDDDDDNGDHGKQKRWTRVLWTEKSSQSVKQDLDWALWSLKKKWNSVKEDEMGRHKTDFGSKEKGEKERKNL